MRYTPFETMDRLFDQMRREMDDLQDWRSLDRNLGIDVAEHGDEYVVTADLPGFEREEIDLRFVDGTLHLSATHDAEEDTSVRRRSVAERISIPGDVAEDEISARYHNGVLEVHLPVEDWGDTGVEIDVA